MIKLSSITEKMVKKTKTTQRLLRKINAANKEHSKANTGIDSTRLKHDAGEVISKNGKELHSSNGRSEQYKIIVDALNEGALVLNKEGAILFCNERFCEMTGKNQKILKGTLFSELIHAEEKEGFSRFFRDGFETSRVARFYLICKNKTIIPVQISVKRIKEAGTKVLSMVVTDLSDITKSIETLVKSEIFFKSLIENSADMITLINSKGNIIFTTPAVERVYGYTEKEVLGMNSFKTILHPDDLKKARIHFEEVLRSPLKPVPLMVRNRRKDGKYIWVEGTIKNLLDEPGINALVCNFHDITQRKLAEEGLEKLNRELMLLNEAQNTLSKTLDLNSIYDKTYDIVSEIITCDSMVISSYSREDNMLRCLSVWADGQKLEVSDLPALPLAPEGHGIQSPVIRTGKSRLILDYSSYYKTSINKFSKSGGKITARTKKLYSSALVVPVKTEGNVIGTIQVFSYKASAYNEDDLRLLELLTAPISAATLNASLYQQAQNEIGEREKAEISLKKRTEEITLLYESEKELSSTLDIQSIYDKVYEIVSKIMPCSVMSIALFDDKEKLIKILAFWQNGKRKNADNIPHIKYNAEGGIQSKVIRSAKGLLLNNYTEELMKTGTKYFIKEDSSVSAKQGANIEVAKSALLAPVITEGRVIGVIQILSSEENAYNDDYMRILEALATQVSSAITNARLYQQAQNEITEKIKKEKELSEIRKNLEDAQRISHLGSWVRDIKTNRIYNSEEVYRIVGLNPVKGSIDADIAMGFIYDKDREAVRGIIESAIQQKKLYVNEYRIKRPDGEIRYVRVMGEPVQDEKGILTRMQGTMQDITDIKRITDELVKSVNEKELMLKEIHHRVKNNLQVVSSLLRLQSDKIEDKSAVEYLQQSEQRVKSMGLIHQQLYRTKDLTMINFNDYINELCSYLFFAYGVNKGRINLKTNVDKIFFGIDTALPCGLIINELLTNSIKHAFPGGRKGNIEISLSKDKDNMNNLIIKDDGIGAGNLNFENASTMGMELVNMLTEQLEGKIEVKTCKGTEIKISFRDLIYKDRI